MEHPAQCLAWIAGRSLDRSQSTAVEKANGAGGFGEDGCMDMDGGTAIVGKQRLSLQETSSNTNKGAMEE